MRWEFLLLSGLVLCAEAWDNDDLEVFDVVEEVNQNFYELMGVSPDSSQSEIKSAFRQLTLKLHPDKNDSPDADVQFRNLVSVHNILKDPGKREKYNEVLKNGLPNWRSAVYYYRHVRKMGLAEGAIILFIITTFGQYLVGWASYFEKRYTAEQILSAKTKKTKKSGFDTAVNEILDQLPKPTIWNTLPFQIPMWTWAAITALPRAITEYREMKKKEEEEARKQKKREEEEERVRLEREASLAEFREKGGARKRRGFVPPERECLLDSGDEPASGEDLKPVKAAPAPPVITGGLWTDDDLAELVRLVKKFPGGTPERWERIAEAMCRSVGEVTHMAAKMKENCYKVPGQEPEPVVVEPPKKVKTRKTEEVPAGNWSQPQQAALESALAKYPKGGAADRWQKIAQAVPGKTKEECMARCRYLSEMVKKQKQQEEESQALGNGDCETVQTELTS
ncbi:hypothetical protein O0L34_g7398 [Tuta absoluta]|nr:hypothetical protein O0L34_g7398 [Tuta absoluta]